MFETSSKSGSNVNRAVVALTLADGATFNVSVRLTLSNKIADALNNADLFLDIITMDGEQMFIAKADVRQAKLVDIPKANQLNFHRRAADDRATFDPYAVLKIDKSATSDQIKQAYHKMTQSYHPDRLSSFDLPVEIHEYARVMQVRINLAYEQIGR
jgi:DnaJ-domain-containing protein 1